MQSQECPDDTQSAVSVKVENLEFSDGTKIELGRSDIVVFVGPNNAGKSAALREIEGAFSKQKSTVLKSIKFVTEGSIKQLEERVRSRSRETFQNGQSYYSGLGYRIYAPQIQYWWPDNLAELKPLFLTRLSTEDRITQSNAVNAINTLEQDPSHPIHLVSANDQLEKRISGYFRKAFGKDLIVYRGGGSMVPLFVGDSVVPEAGEDRVSYSYLSRLRDQASPLQEQGDGMRSFATMILHLLAVDDPSILMLDEPESFLHPPQARLIGEFIARERKADTQLFIATHSPDLLMGLLGVASEKLRVIRIQRAGSINRVKELEKNQAKEIGADPLMKYSGVISGVFHHRVIITESDADAMFYGALLDLPSVHGDVSPDALFVHAGGKHRMGALARALRGLDVNVDIIADIDVLNDEGTLERLISALGGDWATVSKDAIALKKAIEQHKPWLTSAEVANAITAIVETTPKEGEFPREAKRQIDAVFRKASPWDAVKEAGGSAVPAGQATVHWESLLSYCRSIGLWIVPVGEIEGFCKSVGGHGPKWTQRVIETYNLAEAQELETARLFVKRIWQRL